MYPTPVHFPSPPQETSPPPGLVHAIESFKHPEFHQVGLTCTVEGAWAALVYVPADTEVPIAGIETFFAPFPVVYVAAPTAPYIPYSGSAKSENH